MDTLLTADMETLADVDGNTLGASSVIKIIKIGGKVINKFSNKILKSFAGTEASSVTNVSRVAQPSLSLDGTTLTITGTEGATTSIYINGALSATTTNATYDISSFITEKIKYAVKVLQNKSGYIVSLFSDAVEYDNREQLPTPSSLSADDTTITFTAVNNASTYEVFANDTSIGESAGEEVEETYEYTQDGDTVALSDAPYTQDDDTVTIK